MMAKEPNKADYRAWQQQQYYADSLAWAKDPLYGWCNKNFKKDGTPYDIYVDGLKVYTTIDSRMQRYAEEAVRGHVGLYLQKQFEKERASSPNFPYASSLSSADVKRSLQRAMQQTDRYRLMKQAGASDEEIQKADVYKRQPIEWVIAVELERHYTKEEILTLYLNYFDFLHNAVGIKTAAQVYFNKQPRDLTITEAATLIGMCKNPSYFNPVREPERCRERRNVVLHQMLKAGYITDAEYAEHCEKPLALNFHRVDPVSYTHLGAASQAFCMAMARAATNFKPSSKLKQRVAVKAESSPKEWPAAISGLKSCPRHKALITLCKKTAG